MSAKAKKESFDAQLAQLQEIVERLESEELPLEQAYELFEKGIALHKACRSKLDEIEKKIETLLADEPEGGKGGEGDEGAEDEEIPF